MTWMLYVIPPLPPPPSRERATAHRTLRRQDKKLKDLMQSVEDERKQAENYKAEVGPSLHVQCTYMYDDCMCIHVMHANISEP